MLGLIESSARTLYDPRSDTTTDRDHLQLTSGRGRKGRPAGVNAALVAVLVPEMILKDGLIDALGEVGRLFEKNGYFVPEMLVSARAMQGGLVCAFHERG